MPPTVLPKPMRLTTPAEFSAVLKAGRRAGTRNLAVHVLTRPNGSEPGSSQTAPAGPRPTRVGFVVSSKVGNSVVRHRVTRHLREQVRPMLAEFAGGIDIVVRALPGTAALSSAEVRTDLRSALRKFRTP